MVMVLSAKTRGRLVGALVVRHTVDEDRHVADPDRRVVENECGAGPSGRGDEPAPVRIAAVNRRLDQRRIGDGPRRQPGVSARRGAGDAHGDELGRALAATHDLAREMAGNRVEALRETPGSSSRSTATPEAPDASRNTQSLVEHSPSTVIALNVSSTTRRRAPASTRGSTRASVVRNPSIVAIRGSIIPEPLAMPPTGERPSRQSASATASDFGKGSVVMIARVAASAARDIERAAALTRRRSELSPDSRCTPMTPVDATSTCSTAQPTVAAAAAAIALARAEPDRPGTRVRAAAVDDHCLGAAAGSQRGALARRRSARRRRYWS